MKEFWSKNKRAIIVIIAVAGLILYNVHLYKKALMAEKKAQVAEHNLVVANDTIRIIKDRQDRIEYNKLAYLTDKVTNLEKLSHNLANEVKSIKGTVSTVIQGQIKIVEKPVPFIVKGELIDSTVKAYFNYDSTYSPGNYRKLSGYTAYNLRDGVVVAQKQVDEFGIKFTTGIKDLDKGKPEIFLKSDYPGFSVTKLEGAQLDPKLFEPKVKVSLITPTLSVGYTPILYSPSSKRVTLENRFGITIGVGFNLFKVMGMYK